MASVGDQFRDMQRQAQQFRTGFAGIVSRALQGVNVGSRLATGALGALSAGLKGLSQALTAPLSAVQGMAAAITQMVELANPGVVMQFTLALRDALAVMGGMLTPVMQGMTIAVRAIGDTFAALTPVLQPLFNQIGQLFADWAVVFKEVIKAAAPLIQLFSDAMVDALRQLAVGFAMVEGVIIEVYHAIAELFGLKSRFDPNAKSQGAAVRQTHVGSVESFAGDVFKKSLQGVFGAGQGKKPEQIQGEILSAIAEGRKWVIEIRQDVGKIWDWFNKRREAAEQFIGGAKEGAGAAARDLFPIPYLLGKMFVK